MLNIRNVFIKSSEIRQIFLSFHCATLKTALGLVKA